MKSTRYNVEELDVPFGLSYYYAIAIQGNINYNSTSGRKMFSGAIAKLDEELYDCKPEGLYQFLQSQSNRAQDIGWSSDEGILVIPEDPTSLNPVLHYLIDNYGVVSTWPKSEHSKQLTSTARTALHRTGGCLNDLKTCQLEINSWNRFMYNTD